eukprot:CAMPEP_0170778784 /NCGR_PEP_ID=MMETSP0733-20121128/12598_1 /TAXON_ID=186038 /ORGANISM="Fragilariopsis kerguelensis, Strain L26-C5" /LENGTH=112 /DNA_ID=CAMNT_0011122275 /DNA_START=172 /DNA_END=510 /DNA_ORIENTATION=-
MIPRTIPRTIPMRSVQSIKRQRQRQRREEEEEADDRTDNAEKEEEEEEEEDDYKYDQVICENELDRDKHEYLDSKIITQADRTVEQQAQAIVNNKRTHLKTRDVKQIHQVMS